MEQPFWQWSASLTTIPEIPGSIHGYVLEFFFGVLGLVGGEG